MSAAGPPPGSEMGFADQPVDVRRYLDALRRGVWLIATIAIVVTVAVAVISRAQAKSYSATAHIIYNPTTSPLQSTEAASLQRQLATFQYLAQTPAVIARAAAQLSEPPATLKAAIGVATEESTNIITVSASAPRAALSAARANAVARAFLAEQTASQNLGLANAESQLKAQIAQLRGTPGSEAEIAALQQRISALQIGAAGTASELQLAGVATPPESPASPHPARNAVVALFAALLIGVLVVLARDQLRPRFTTPRELGQTLGLTVLTGVPYRHRLGTRQRRRALAGLELEAYDVLQASVRLLGTNGAGPRVLLVTSATHGEGKTTVTASLARSLARAGQRTLAISGDMRSPSLHSQLGLPGAPGLSDCLLAAERGTGELEQTLERSIREAPGDLGLELLAAGPTPADPSSLLSGPALAAVFETLRALDYGYILIDSPPALGLSDTQFLARQADDVLVVARLDRVTPDQGRDLVDLLRRLRIAPIGLVVVGARAEISPYYMTEHHPPGTPVAERPAIPAPH